MLMCIVVLVYEFHEIHPVPLTMTMLSHCRHRVSASRRHHHHPSIIDHHYRSRAHHAPSSSSVITVSHRDFLSDLDAARQWAVDDERQQWVTRALTDGTALAKLAQNHNHFTSREGMAHCAL